MSRVLRFRAWDTELKEMVYAPEPHGAFNQFSFWHDYDERRYEWMQFTGIHDKNGKEVYEGDILKCDGRDAPPSAVYWDDKLLQWSASVMLWAFHKPVVVGNVWENPELIEKL